MQDADATGEHDPIGRVSLHDDTDNDGVYDKHTVFVDNLVFPRFLLPFGPNALLTKESHAQEVWKYTDTNGDGVADKKELFDTGYGRLRQRRARRELPHLGPRQLDVQHGQRVPRALDAARRRSRSRPAPTARSGASRRTTTARCGSRAGRAACPSYWQFPIRLRQLRRRPRQLRDGSRSRHPVGRAGAGRRHAGRPEHHPHARWLAPQHDGRRRRRYRPRRIACRRTCRATTCTANRSRRIVRRVRAGDSGRADHDQELLRRQRVHQVDRSVLPPGRSDDRA